MKQKKTRLETIQKLHVLEGITMRHCASNSQYLNPCNTEAQNLQAIKVLLY